MREFLRRVYLANGYKQLSWHVARFDYARWHCCLNCAGVGLDEVARIWEEGGNIVSFFMPDGGRGEAHFMIDPQEKSSGLEEEMLQEAEAHLPETGERGEKRLTVWAHDTDAGRISLLQRRGYIRQEWGEWQWRTSLDRALPEVRCETSYVIRSLGEGLELLERCWASGLVFHDGDITVAADNREDPGWYRNIQRAPLYRRDLDLVAEAPDGSIAGFCTAWFDDVHQSAYIEPVGTVPRHQKKGLAAALMAEALRRLKHMGAVHACVGGYTPAANKLYQSMMGETYDLYRPWVRSWQHA